ncbi:hypothetical protein GCM10028801_46150 [Nocardioides maradonensis]
MSSTSASVVQDWLASLPVMAAAGCVSLVRSDDAQPAILAAFGAEPAVDLAEQPDWPDRVGIIEVAGHGSIAIEPDGGYQGTRPEVLRDLARMSPDGRSAALQWDVNDTILFACVDGKKYTNVELSGWAPSEVMSLPGSLRRWARAHVQDLMADPVLAGITMALNFTGMAELPRDLDGATPYLAISPRPPTDNVDTLESTPLHRADPATAALVGQLSPERQREIAEWVTRRILKLARLDDDVAILEVVGQFGNARPPRLTSGARRRLARIDAETRVEAIRANGRNGPPSSLLQRLWLQQSAAYCLKYTCHPDPATAAWRTVFSSTNAFAGAEIADPDDPLAPRFAEGLARQLAEPD